MRIHFFLYFLALPLVTFSQNKNNANFDINTKYQNSDTLKGKKKQKVATIDQYRFITLDKDTTYVDTSLTIQKEYSHNYLRKDTFGLLSFPNEGQTYNTLQYSLTDYNPYPEFGFKAKHFNFLEANQIKYCSVATPVTELFFKTTINKGQSVDSFLSVNTSPELNFSIAYSGLRSLGEYINQLSSIGNFRFTTSYSAKKGRYFANAHFTSQDISNGENGGITTTSDFENEDPSYDNKAKFEVYLNDAKSFLKGKRIFLDHVFRLNKNQGIHNFYFEHQFNYENKFFEYNQVTVPSILGSREILRFGTSFAATNINDQTHYNKMYNKGGIVYENAFLGKFRFFADDFRSNYYYNQVLFFDDKRIIPSSISQNSNSVGGQYNYQKNKWNGSLLLSRSIKGPSLSNLDAKLLYEFNNDNHVSFQYKNINKLPNNNYSLFQSSYVAYNWSNDFKNEKINSISVNASTRWGNASVELTNLRDHLYFSDVSTIADVLKSSQIVAPKQYNNTINYLSIKLSKEFKLGKFALDNTLLYQKVDQNDAILNVPEIVTRNTLYYSDTFFKKALFLQTGFVFNYFTNYYANDYNPVLGEFFVQNKKQIGNFPNFDFFINARIQRTRIYLKAEHFNASFSGNNYYSAPNTPYRDFTIRFGLVWNFFN
jgi:hypothetical protein